MKQLTLTINKNQEKETPDIKSNSTEEEAAFL
jgi:hypothetical protein